MGTRGGPRPSTNAAVPPGLGGDGSVVCEGGRRREQQEAGGSTLQEAKARGGRGGPEEEATPFSKEAKARGGSHLDLDEYLEQGTLSELGSFPQAPGSTTSATKVTMMPLRLGLIKS